MKTMRILIVALAIMTAAKKVEARTGEKKILVAWYSWGGNTEAVARHIQELTGADVFVIEPEEPYSTDYRTCTEEAKSEINAGRSRTIKGRVPDLDRYDFVFLGTPNWWSTMAPPVLAFLAEHDLSGKTIAPFVTHGGGGESRCITDMKKNAPSALFLEGLVVSGNLAGSSKGQVEKWLEALNLPDSY